MYLLSKIEFQTLHYLITYGDDALQVESYKNGIYKESLKTLRRKSFLMIGMPFGKSDSNHATYKITSEEYHAYHLYKDNKQWFTPRYVLENIVVPITIAVITTLILK